MEWGFFPHLAHLLATRGFTVVRFNFPGGGMRPGDDLVSDREAFAHATVGDDLRGPRGGSRRRSPTAASPPAGSTASGWPCSATAGAAAPRSWRRRVIRGSAALVTWSAVATFDRLSEDEKAAWRQLGRVPIVNARTGQALELDRSVLDDLEARARRVRHRGGGRRAARSLAHRARRRRRDRAGRRSPAPRRGGATARAARDRRRRQPHAWAPCIPSPDPRRR